MKGGRSEARDPPFSARGRPEHSLRNADWLNYRKAPQAAHWASVEGKEKCVKCEYINFIGRVMIDRVKKDNQVNR
jgi:hypothetical protein